MEVNARLICTVTNDLTYDQRMIRICGSLAAHGYLVKLLGRCLTHSKSLVHQPFQQQRLTCFFQKKVVFYLEYNIRLFFFLLFQKVDIIYAVDLDTLLPCFLVSKIRGKKLVYDAHEYFTEVPELANRKIVKTVWEILANWLIPKSQYNITVGKELAEVLSNKYGVPFEVIRNVPFATTIPTAIPKAQPPVLLYQGVLNDGRGIEEMLLAMQHIDNAQLWIVGEGDLSESLRALKTRLQVGKKVHFWGYQTPEQLKILTPQATIGLNLLQNKSLNYYYSLANKAFDYVQAEIPSINMRFPEYVHLNEVYQVFELVDDLTTSSLVSAVQKLLSDADYYQKLAKNCQEARQQWTWKNEEPRLVGFMNIVLLSSNLRR